MENLESALNEVKDLKDQLSRVIVIQEEKGEWKNVLMHGGGYACESTFLTREPVYFVTSPRVTKPDTEAQDEARAKLLSIYWLSQYSRVRYRAARALGYSQLRILQEEFWRTLEIF